MLYRTYRPTKFNEIEGLSSVTSVLTTQLKEDSVGHAYLFHGPKGTGKTTTARLLAQSLFCTERDADGEACGTCASCEAFLGGAHVDLVEIDAASNRGIDDIRALKEAVHLTPATGEMKVYIIDEVHMLTREAFNALLKTLEEPPSHAVFILCTTELHKVPATIISRCQRLQFSSASLESLVSKLKRIAEAEGAVLEDSVFLQIASVSSGGFRDAETLLEQVLAGGEEVLSSMGGEVQNQVQEFVHALLHCSVADALLVVNEYLGSGGSLEFFSGEVVSFIRRILLSQISGAEGISPLSVSEQKWVEKQGQRIPEDMLSKAVAMITQQLEESRYSSVPQLPLELGVVRFCSHTTPSVSTEPQPVPSEPIPEKKKPVVKKVVESDSGLLGKWDDILTGVKPYNHSIEALLRSCRPLTFNDGRVVIETLYKFHKDRLESATNKKVVQDVLSEILGTNVAVSFTLGETPVATVPYSPPENMASTSTPTNDTAAASDADENADDGFSMFTSEIS